LFLKI